MSAIKSINLNDSWQYLFADEEDIDLKTIQQETLVWVPLTDLSDWVIASTVEYGIDWFWRRVDLDIDQNQSRFVLNIDKVPDSVLVYVNGRLIGEVESRHGFKSDITSYLRSGKNDIMLKLTCTPCAKGGGRFGDITINPVRNNSTARLH